MKNWCWMLKLSIIVKSDRYEKSIPVDLGKNAQGCKR